MTLLESITGPRDLKALSPNEVPALASEIRDVLIVVALLLALVPREVRSLRSGEAPGSGQHSEAETAHVMAGS